MGHDGFFGDPQAVPNLGGGEPFGEQTEHLPVPRAKPQRIRRLRTTARLALCPRTRIQASDQGFDPMEQL
ncbi:MAG: hypothetical protein VBE63_23820 [Lamprobacter sp.]|uniref:hypothetical protein n=1 Tax=Lamprobacter sp. TaxID=3100796 RepID=UPI002B25F378|nr:hypothetical protein [Lamprobacter sp.]MEA3642944.1 hypothetical protein [Lamprobacter sp.]